MGIFRNIKELKIEPQQKEKKSEVHPFTVVKKEHDFKKYVYLLLFITIAIYGFIFYMEFKKRENLKKEENNIKPLQISKITETKVKENISNIKIPESKQEKIKALFDKAYKAYKEGKTSEALYYIKIIQEKKDYIPAIILKAKVFQKEGLHDRARTVLEEAYYKYPENKDILLNLAEIYEKEGALVIAKDMYKVLDEMGYIEGSFKYAEILEKLGQREEALKVYKKLYENPNISEKDREQIQKKILLLEK
ncbi:MAG: tetratricopeptide repeat protein [Aquificae bacterium]|nr:tetratricopeptide repeat protein [Aquificota bacterium]